MPLSCMNFLVTLKFSNIHLHIRAVFVHVGMKMHKCCERAGLKSDMLNPLLNKRDLLSVTCKRIIT